MNNIEEKNFDLKKISIILVGILVIVLIISLSSLLSDKDKKLKCQYNNSDKRVTIIEIYNATFEDNKLSELVVYFKKTLTNDYVDMLDDTYDNYFEQLEAFKNAGGYEYTIEKGNDFVEFEATIDLNLIPDTTKDKLGFNNQWNYEDFKKNLENNEFICE